MGPAASEADSAGLVVEKLPSGGLNKPVSLWGPGAGAVARDVDRRRQSFLRRFDLEYTFRLVNRHLAGQAPARSSKAVDRWTWLVIAAHAGLPGPPSRLTRRAGSPVRGAQSAGADVPQAPDGALFDRPLTQSSTSL